MNAPAIASVPLALFLLANCSTPPSGAADASPTGEGRQRGPTVIVLDEAGGPVPGAEVWIVDRLTLRAEKAVVASRLTGDWVETSIQIASEIERADATGVARFGVEPESGVLVAARSGALFGGVELRAVKADRIEVRVRPRPTYRVRVVGPDGEPLEGVPMSLGIPSGDGRAERLAATSRTGADGIAVLYEPPAAAFPTRRRKSTTTARVAAARIATQGVQRVHVDEVDVAELELPATGAVEVVASHPEFPTEHWGGVVQVFAAADGSRSELTLANELVRGRVTVPYVEVGVDLRVVSVLTESPDSGRRLVGTHSAKLAPIEAAGETAERTIELGAGALFEGRLVDGEGNPIADRAVDVRVVRVPSTSWTLITDDRGAFRWLLTAQLEALGDSELVFRAGLASGNAVIPASTAGATVELGPIELR